MLVPTLTCALLLGCLLLQGCLLFTEKINTKPEVDLLQPAGTFAAGEEVTVTAMVSDADGDPLTVEWSTATGKCAPTLDPSKRPPAMLTTPNSPRKSTFTLPPGRSGRLCVWVNVTDPQGASATKAVTVSYENRAPKADIQVLSPTTMASNGAYELYSSFRLSSARSSDPDGDEIATRTWNLKFPQTATPTPVLRPCSSTMPENLVVCLDVHGFSGNYVVQLMVNDGSAPSPLQELTLTVNDDHPACVSATDPKLEASPIVEAPGNARRLAVTQILDDGAPYPTPPDGAWTAPGFAWQLRRNGEPWQPIVGFAGFPELTLPASSFASGDVVDVMVTISDGMTTHMLNPACNPGCPAGCPQTATWKVEYR
jgi:hypothetical protein